jgi:tripartite ATP-independent transporter DctP family solute receptor
LIFDLSPLTFYLLDISSFSDIAIPLIGSGRKGKWIQRPKKTLSGPDERALSLDSFRHRKEELMKKAGMVGLSIIVLLFVANLSCPCNVVGQTKDLVIKISHPGAPDHPWQVALKRYGELVEKRTNGKVKIELFPNSQLSGGNERTMVEQLMMGTQQMALYPTSLASEKLVVFGLPFLWSSREKIYAACDGALGQEILKMHEPLRLKALALWENGFRQITNNKRPIVTPADMKGLKLRVPHAAQLLEAAKALGAIPIPITLGELYMALQQGTADGQENPVSSIYKSKYYEVQKYMTVINYSWSPMTLAMNKAFFDKQPADIRKVLEETAKELSPYARQLIQDDDKDYTKKLEEAGMQVTVLTPAQIMPFREATKGVAAILEPNIGKELLAKFQNAGK